MLNKIKILEDLHKYNENNKQNGFVLFSLFGSFAKDTHDNFSDIDITYKIDHDKFYKDNAFKKLAKIDEIKKELQIMFHKKIDLIPANTNNKHIQKSLENEQILI